MKIIRTKIHGMADYPIGLGVVASPWIFGFQNGGLETVLPVLVGTLFIVFSLITNYEWGMARYISMSSHLFLDGVIGLLLTLSPWIFGFEEVVYVPHLLCGAGMMAMAVFTSSTPYIYLYYSGQHSSYNIRNLP